MNYAWDIQITGVARVGRDDAKRNEKPLSGAARRRCQLLGVPAGAITLFEEARAFRGQAQHRVSATDTNWQASGMAASGWHAEE